MDRKRKSLNILSLGGSWHDLSACLVVDGKIKFAIEDERLTRIKHSVNLDEEALLRCNAAKYCLEAEGLLLENIDLIMGNDTLDPRYLKAFDDSVDKMQLINHHLAHAASAYYPSSFEEAAVMVIDGAGSLIDRDNQLHETTSYYHGKGSELIEIKKYLGGIVEHFPVLKTENTIGGLYTAITEILGFKMFEEGKTMGLAPYGTDCYVNEFNKFYDLDEDGGFFQNKKHYKIFALFLFRSLSKKQSIEKLEQVKADIAYALQHHLEQIVIKACHYLHRITGSKNLCIAGGVGLNSVLNYKILQETPFENVFVQPSAGDAGMAIGSALYGHFKLSNQPREITNQLFSPYLGKEYDEVIIEKAISQFGDRLNVTKLDSIYEKIARLLSEGKIIGWFQGRSEIGPRALGNRSILADPRNAEMKDTINSRIKHREAFRPFAPIILEERQEEYFSMKHPSYYMMFVPHIHLEKRNEIPSVTHVDGTGRVQTVSKLLNPVLHELLDTFYEQTGVPVLLNTSFNDNGEPIVESPSDAIKCFLNIDLDYLVIHNYLISKVS